MGDVVKPINRRQGGAGAGGPRPPRPELAATAYAVLADYHAYTAIVMNEGGEAEAAEVTGGPLAVHAARLAAELAAVLAEVSR